MWRKGNPHALFVRMLIGVATMGNNMEVPQKMKNRTTMWSGTTIYTSRNETARSHGSFIFLRVCTHTHKHTHTHTHEWKEMKIGTSRDICTPMFISALRALC